MPNRDFPHRAIRLAILELTVAVMLEHRESYRVGDDDGAVMVAMAVAIGHMQRRPMTPTKLAYFLHKPKTTVYAKLKILIERGIVEKHGDKYLLTPERADLTKLPGYDARVSHYTSLMKRTFAVLRGSALVGAPSETDARTIDRTALRR